MLKEFEEVEKLGAPGQYPWNDKLFDVDDKSELLQADKAETFHTFVAKALFLCMRARPDILPAVAFLCTRVQKPTQQDWGKRKRMMKFLKGTKDDVLTLKADNFTTVNWFWDASFAVHKDFKSHTGGTMTMGK